jgi:hypothetical protein
MKLEEAWKNMLLDSIGQKGQLKKLEEIHKQEVENGMALNRINETIKERSFPAVVV